MSVFNKGETKIHRRVVTKALTAAASFDVPAGARVISIYARNRTATATNLTVGNAAAGTQFLTSTAVPTGTTAAPGYLYSAATAVAPNAAATKVHITLSAYPAAPGVDVTIEFEELEESLPIPTQHYKVGY